MKQITANEMSEKDMTKREAWAGIKKTANPNEKKNIVLFEFLTGKQDQWVNRLITITKMAIEVQNPQIVPKSCLKKYCMLCTF